MSPNKYFYVITRDGQIFEVEYNESRLSASVQAMRDKGLLSFKDTGMVINGSDITKILNEDNYENYIATAKPREYIKNGTWYDRDHNFVRNEPWKQVIVDAEKQKRLQKPVDYSKPITFKEFIDKHPEHIETYERLYGRERFERILAGDPPFPEK